jgi:site-specific recombinase XerC
VKQQLAAVRMLFDRLITGQAVPTNPAAAVRGPKYVVTTGKTPVLDGSEWRRLLNAIPTETVRDLRDRALIGTPHLLLRPRWRGVETEGGGSPAERHRLADSSAEKGGKEPKMPCHHALSEMLQAYVARGRHRQRSQGRAVPHQSGAQRDGERRAGRSVGRSLAQCGKLHYLSTEGNRPLAHLEQENESRGICSYCFLVRTVSRRQ